MFSNVKELLSGVPSTQPGGRVVPLETTRDPTQPPGGWAYVYREIKTIQMEIANRSANKSEMERHLAETTAQAQQAIATAERDIQQSRARLDEAHGRLAMMLADLGIDIREENEG